MSKRPLFLLTAVLLALPALAADWPQWRGPHRDDVSRETGLLKEWPDGGPKLLWTYDNAGVGYSGPAVVGDVLYLMGGRDRSTYLYALDLKTAGGKDVKELWAVKMGPVFTWRGNQWNAGPSSTPTVEGGHVYALDSQGELVCVAAAGGKKVWQKSLPKDLSGEVNPIGGGPEKIGWGYAGSPLVDGDKLVCVPGGPQGMVAALNKKTGEVVWRSKELTDQATYSSPIAAEIGGVRQYVVMTQEGAAAVAAADGKLLWYYKREEPYGDIVAPTPVVKGDLVFITAAPSGGRDLIKVTRSGDKFSAAKVYADKEIENHHGGVLLVGDNLYGCSGERRTKWFCQEFKSGKLLWEEDGRKLGKGSLTCADGCLYCVGEKTGLVLLAEASPAGWKPKGQFKLPQESKKRPPSGGLWTHPVVANGRLYLRDQELLFCYDVQAKK
jgi:outer membrane protein assembly factor BamB